VGLLFETFFILSPHRSKSPFPEDYAICSPPDPSFSGITPQVRDYKRANPCISLPPSSLGAGWCLGDMVLIQLIFIRQDNIHPSSIPIFPPLPQTLDQGLPSEIFFPSREIYARGVPRDAFSDLMLPWTTSYVEFLNNLSSIIPYRQSPNGASRGLVPR